MKKPCAKCGQRIPRAAPVCRFCGQAQPQSGPPPPWAAAAMAQEGPLGAAAASAPAAELPQGVTAELPPAAPPSQRSPEPPVLPSEEGAAEAPPSARSPVLLAEPASDEEAPPAPPPVRPARRPVTPLPLPPPAPFLGRVRFLHAVSGAVLLTLFFLPWQGARSWDMLRYLQGPDFARQLGLLVIGAALLSTGLLPVPPAFRAAIGVGLGVTYLCLGGFMLNVWQRLLGVLVVTILPGSLLVRTHLRRARLPRLLGLMAVLGLLSLYIVPRDGVAPIRVAVDLVYYQRDDMARFIGTYLLLPLPLVSLATVALLGADVAIIGELLSWLLLCWGPGALLVLAIDNTQAYTAAAVLCCAACAAYGTAELLRRITKTVEPER